MTERRSVVTGLAALPLLALVSGFFSRAAAQGAGLQGEAIATSAGGFVVHPVEHASLLLGFLDQVIYIDPVGGASAYADLPAPTAILITHGHGDHFDIPTLEAIAGEAPIIANPDVFSKLPESLKSQASALANGEAGTLNGIAISAIPAHNTTADRMNYHPVGVGNGYLITLGDKVVYVAGDTEPTPEMLALKDIAVAFLPMNLPYTMTPEQALAAINSFKPAIVYPYHYGDSDLSVLEAGINADTELRLRNWYPKAG